MIKSPRFISSATQTGANSSTRRRASAGDPGRIMRVIQRFPRENRQNHGESLRPFHRCDARPAGYQCADTTTIASWSRRQAFQSPPRGIIIGRPARSSGRYSPKTMLAYTLKTYDIPRKYYFVTTASLHTEKNSDNYDEDHQLF